MKKYDVFGLGNALMDLEFRVDDAFLKELSLEKGIMTLIDEEKERSIVHVLENHPSHRACGGSAANTIIMADFIFKDDQFYFLEMTPRPGGDCLPDLIQASLGYDTLGLAIEYAVDKNIEDAEHAELSGTFYSKVYEGSFNETGKWSKDFTNSAISKGLEVKKIYMWYTTCPKCAKKYGKNYVVLTGLIE